VEAQRVGVDLEEREQMTDFLKIPAGEPIPLSILELDLPAPAIGWAAELAARGVEIVLDDLGRAAVSRRDARRLFEEKREAEQHAAEVRARNEQRAVEADRRRRAQIWGGIRADQVPDGMTATQLMLASDPDRQRGRRRTPLEDALANDGMTFYSLHEPAEDEPS
jgi:hypothetical protein